MRSVAALKQSHVISSVGRRKELSCPTQKSNPPQQVLWYRATNDDAKKCPNQTFFLDIDSVLCDRLLINRKVEPGFEQRFSAPLSGQKNENGLLIISVEVSDAGTYACVSHNKNIKILARINFTVEGG